MLRPTLANYRAQFPVEVMGICQADPQVVTFCNDSQQRLLIDPLTPDEGWWGGWVTLNASVTVTNGAAFVTTPREIARLIVTDVCQHPIRIRNGFWEYLQFGRGLQPKVCRGRGCGDTFQAYERDTVPTLAPLLPSAQKIRVYPTDARDSGLRVLVQGLDANSQVILSTDPVTGLSSPGEYLVLKFPFVESVNEFTTISGIQKDETYGPIQFFQVSPTTGAEVALSAMEPNEETGWYRRYLIAGIPNVNLCCSSPGNPITVTAQGRIDFIPVANETDYLTLPCIPALIQESISIHYERMDSGSAAQKALMHHQKALSYLNGQLDLYEGKTSTAVRIPIFGSQKMHRQLV